MRLLDRYLVRELTVPFLVGTVAVVMMFLANMLIAYAPQMFSKEVPLIAVLQYLYFKIPGTLNMTLPVGITIASALAVSRLVRESELTAMRASGIPIRRTLVPVFLTGILVAVSSFFLAERVTPVAERHAFERLRKIFASPEVLGMRTNTTFRIGDGQYYVSIGTVRDGPRGTVVFDDVLVLNKPKRGEDWVLQAKSGSYDDGILTLYRPSIWIFNDQQLVDFSVEDAYTINLRLSREDFFGNPLPEEQTLTELRQNIERLRRIGAPTHELEVDYHSRYAVPAACFVFAIFSPVFALWFARGGAFIGVLFSIITVFLYYNIWVISAQILARKGLLPPLVGVWLPNALFVAAALVALWKSE